MELRQYWRIVRRYLWLIVIVVGATALASLALRLTHPRQQSYAASMRFTVGVTPEDGAGRYYTYDRYYTWLASEYLVDDLSEVVRSGSFANAVSAELAAQGIAVPAGAISGSTVPVKQHRILTVTISGADPDRLQAIANAAAKVLSEQNAEFLAQLSSENAAVYLIDAPGVYALPSSLRDRLDLPLRLALALAAALALAFVLDYVDDSVRDERDLQALGMPLLVTLPRGRG
jgi:capsular polysaccharide biosynthesis protein